MGALSFEEASFCSMCRFRKHFYRGVLQCVLEEHYKDEQPAESTMKEAEGGPPPVPGSRAARAAAGMGGNKEHGWVVGAQTKLAAAAARDKAAEVAETAKETKPPQKTSGGKSWDQAVNSQVSGGSFAGYAAAALKRLGLPEKLSAEELRAYEVKHEERRQQIAVRACEARCSDGSIYCESHVRAL